MSMTIDTKMVTIIHNPVAALLKTDDKAIKRLVASVLSYESTTMSKGKGGGMNSTTTRGSFYNFRNDTFAAGFVRLVRAKLEKAGVKVLIRAAKAPEPLGPKLPVVDSFGFEPRYSYQIETMERLVLMKNLVAMLATGSGKSRCFKLCAERLGLPTLFVTTRKTLMYQMAEAYEETIGKPVGILGDNVWKPVANGVNFAIVQTLSSRLSDTTLEEEIDKIISSKQRVVSQAIEQAMTENRLPLSNDLLAMLGPKAEAKAAKIRETVMKQYNIDDKGILLEARQKTREQLLKRQETLDLLQGVGFLCLEEAHEVGSDGFFRISQACSNAHYRLALTATPFMRDDEEANMRLMAATGPIGIKVSEKDLIDLEILAKPYFKYIHSVQTSSKIKKHTGWATAYDEGVVKNTTRNLTIVNETLRARKYGLTTMILIQREVHGKQLEKLLVNAGIKTRFISGKDDQTTRKSALKALGDGSLDCLVGSTILDVGVDVPSVGLIVLGGAGKAEVAIRQRIGRGLRAKKTGPNVCFVVDFMDDGNKYLIRHSNERRRIVQDTPGFGENIVPDFDYSIFIKEAAV